MQISSTIGNPFGVLTAVVAPAILTNASSILALGTGNRLARVVDRTRVVAGQMAGLEAASTDYLALHAQLDRLEVRARLLLKALRMFYSALGLFAAAALVSVGGSITAYYHQQLLLFELAAGLAVLTGASAVMGLASECVLMVRETQFAVHNLKQEALSRMQSHG